MKLKLGGVPEHFNYMWQLSAAKELMRSYGIVYDWTDYPGGTGSMIQALDTDELDMAIMLTEGAIAGIADGKAYKILFPFVMSPLLWGVFTSATRKRELPATLETARFAISRFNSGSHLMAKFLAQRHNITLQDSQFILSGNLEGARKVLLSEEADYFLWEKYMTRPLVHSGEFKMTDEISAPWPSFVFVVKRDFNLIDKDVWQQAVYELSSDYLQDSKTEILSGICTQFSLSPEDADAWLSEVRYFDNNTYWKDRILAAGIIMKSKGMLSRFPEIKEII
jgi:sulfonate transport system substrate-binding protein